MNYIPSIGDLLIRPKTLGFINHVGVVVGPDAVLQNSPGRGEHIATIQEFAAGQPVVAHRTGAAPGDVLGRARKILANPRAYDLALRNCEHTAGDVLRGVAKSPQFLLWGALAVVGLLVFLVLCLRR